MATADRPESSAFRTARPLTDMGTRPPCAGGWSPRTVDPTCRRLPTLRVPGGRGWRCRGRSARRYLVEVGAQGGTFQTFAAACSRMCAGFRECTLNASGRRSRPGRDADRAWAGQSPPAGSSDRASARSLLDRRQRRAAEVGSAAGKARSFREVGCLAHSASWLHHSCPIARFSNRFIRSSRSARFV